MNRKYDVIIVGAGNGGLMAAAVTAKNGLKTLLLEKHNIPGGCATSFVRGRFEFEPSLHELCSVGTKEKPGSVYAFFDKLGLKPDWRYESTCFRVILKGEDGYDVTVRGGWDGFCDSLEEAVPGCRESVEKLLMVGKVIGDAMSYMSTVTVPLKFFTVYSDFVKAACCNAEEAMTYLGIPQKAQDIINSYWGYLGVPTDELNAMNFISMVYSYVMLGAAMPHKRSHELSLLLCDSIIKDGGEIWYNSEVTGFLFDETGAVCGVKLGERELFAKEVISNVIPNNVFNMLPADKVPLRDLKLANARELGMSMVTVYLGLDCTKEELGIKDYTVFVTSVGNPRKQYERGADGFYIVNCLNTVIPDCTPNGTSTLFFTMPMFDKDFPKDLKPDQYKKWKNAFAKKYIEDYEKLTGMDILGHIEEIAVATPVTFARYLDTPAGEIYGYTLSDWDNVLTRTVFEQMDNKLKGLTYVGGHASMGDGYSSAYNTGFSVGNAVVARLRG